MKKEEQEKIDKEARKILSSFFHNYTKKIEVKKFEHMYIISISERLNSHLVQIFGTGKTLEEAYSQFYKNVLASFPISVDVLHELNHEAQMGDLLIKMSSFFHFTDAKERAEWLSNYESDKYLAEFFGKLFPYINMSIKMKATVIEAFIWRKYKHTFTETQIEKIKEIKKQLELHQVITKNDLKDFLNEHFIGSEI
jgi:hypothetical protein